MNARTLSFVSWALYGLLPACPSASVPAPSIDAVEVDGSLRATVFDLRLLGKGFGLSGIVYDLAKSEGKTANRELRVRIHNNRDSFALVFGPPDVKVVTPKEITTRVRVEQALEPGTYGVELLAPPAEEPLAFLEAAFVVPTNEPDGGGGDSGPGPDLGSSGDGANGGDTGQGSDLETPDLLDLGTPDAGGLEDGADGGAEDLGPLDLGPPDLGLGPFPGAFGFRQAIFVDNQSGAPGPAGLTIRVPVQHAQLVAQSQSKADGTDLAVYQDQTLLAFAFDDTAGIGTDQLALIAQLPQALSVGTTIFGLYYGDPLAVVPTSQAVFIWVERFDAALTGWFQNGWVVNCNNRTAGAGTSACVGDSGNNPTRLTIGSPATNLTNTVLANETYEISFYIAGRMDEPLDLLYFSYSNLADNFAGSTTLDPSVYVQYPPADLTTFVETTGSARTVTGWRLPANSGMGQVFTRTIARFTPALDRPHLHFRYISPNGSNDGNTLVGVDDAQVRRTLQPEAVVSLGPVEVR